MSTRNTSDKQHQTPSAARLAEPPLHCQLSLLPPLPACCLRCLRCQLMCAASSLPPGDKGNWVTEKEAGRMRATSRLALKQMTTPALEARMQLQAAVNGGTDWAGMNDKDSGTDSAGTNAETPMPHVTCCRGNDVFYRFETGRKRGSASKSQDMTPSTIAPTSSGDYSCLTEEEEEVNSPSAGRESRMTDIVPTAVRYHCPMRWVDRLLPPDDQVPQSHVFYCNRLLSQRAWIVCYHPHGQRKGGTKLQRYHITKNPYDLSEHQALQAVIRDAWRRHRSITRLEAEDPPHVQAFLQPCEACQLPFKGCQCDVEEWLRASAQPAGLGPIAGYWMRRRRSKCAEKRPRQRSNA